MKKLLLSTMLCLGVLSVSSVALAETVNVYWPFSAASPQAVMIRELLINANKQQDKYKFIFVHQAGAGGAVAANTVQKSNGLTLLASTSSFYIRPQLYKNSHDVTKFDMISTVCLGQPLGIVSTDKNLFDNTDKDITLGVIPGSVTSLVVIAIEQAHPTIKIRKVPFSSTPESTTSVLGGHIDGSVEFVGKLTIDRLDKSIEIVGITGTVDKGGYKTFSSLGLKGLENIVNDYFIFAPNTVSQDVQKELNTIFNNALGSKTTEICNDAYGSVGQITHSSAQFLHQQKQNEWNDITQNIEKQ